MVPGSKQKYGESPISASIVSMAGVRNGIGGAEHERGIGKQLRLDARRELLQVPQRERFADGDGVEHGERLAHHRGQDRHHAREVDRAVHERRRDAEAHLAEPREEQLADRALVRAVDAAFAVEQHEVGLRQTVEVLADVGPSVACHPLVSDGFELVGHRREPGLRLAQAAPLAHEAVVVRLLDQPVRRDRDDRRAGHGAGEDRRQPVDERVRAEVDLVVAVVEEHERGTGRIGDRGRLDRRVERVRGLGRERHSTVEQAAP